MGRNGDGLPDRGADRSARTASMPRTVARFSRSDHLFDGPGGGCPPPGCRSGMAALSNRGRHRARHAGDRPGLGGVRGGWQHPGAPLSDRSDKRRRYVCAVPAPPWLSLAQTTLGRSVGQWTPETTTTQTPGSTSSAPSTDVRSVGQLRTAMADERVPSKTQGSLPCLPSRQARDPVRRLRRRGGREPRVGHPQLPAHDRNGRREVEVRGIGDVVP